MLKELGGLLSAWKYDFKRGAYGFITHHKIAVSSFIFFISLGTISWFLKNVVYAQPQVLARDSLFYFPLSEMFPWLLGGGLFGVTMRVARNDYNKFKRIFDLTVSITGFIITFPLFLITAFLVKIDSMGPVFFTQDRVGKDGKLFKIYKFRTMRQNAEFETGPVWAQDDDPRITRLGAFLRNSHLDELPQLFNVLKGDMSLIGPRPERPELIELIQEDISGFNKRTHVVPGVTGLAQVRYEYGSSIKDAARKLKYDCLYIKRMCLFLDFQIILWTVGRVLTGEGAR